jgi:NTP pyrophosphatase (non-canonical NTP hydrolase)
VKPADILRIERVISERKKLMSLKFTVTSRTLETCIEVYINLRRVTNLEELKDENGDLLADSHTILNVAEELLLSVIECT